MTIIAVLFARSNSIYKTMPNCDVYDIDRDARNFGGGMPIVAHPPCRAWGRLRRFAKPRFDEKELAIFAVEQIRRNGGVLEHPAFSTLWKEAKMPIPGKPCDEYGGYSIDINQSWFGHRAQKRTWLYIVGVPLKELNIPLSFDCPTHVVNTSKRKAQGKLQEISKSEREATPSKLAQWLVETARKTTILCPI
jgi:hypothetical protein